MDQLLQALPPPAAFFGQLMIGLINGGFYAILSLGLAIIFGLLNIVNFTHGAQYMLGALCAYVLLSTFGIGYWPALILAPLLVGAFGIVLERVFLKHMYRLNHLYGMLLTFGVSLVLEGLVRHQFGSTGVPYPVPVSLGAAWDLGFMFLPAYRVWVIGASLAVCLLTWLMIERTPLGAHLRAATENPRLTRAFGINVPRLVTLTYGFGVALAALAGVMAAPIYQANAQMGSDVIIVVFAVVVIGGMGSIMGAIVSGFALGVAEGLTRVFYPQASTTIVFLIMVVVLLVRPAGLFGNAQLAGQGHPVQGDAPPEAATPRLTRVLTILAIALAMVAPFVVYPVFLMKVLCFALFASALNLLLGYGGLLSFGHAAYYGLAGYVTAHCVKVFGFDPLLGVLAGMLVATLMGVAFGFIAIRRQGIYFSMVTLALAQLIYFFCVQAPFTHADEGIQGVPRGTLLGWIDLGDATAMYYFVLVLCGLGLWLIFRTIHSPFGNVLKGIRENEPRAISLGYDTERFKLLTFVLSAAMAGLAGSLDALVFQLASLTNVHWAMSGQAILMAILGGVGTFSGPIVGAFVAAAMENYLASLGAWVTVIQGGIFIVCVLVFRRGIVGEAVRFMRRRPSIATPAPKADTLIAKTL
ncbi:branched-chain amino acid ABC transporter permease [Cupriavidus sp. CV2]|uniref:ABC transporter permease n=1 Tax=Cupriavidus ulmosensis TaxID=3065913 RepID=UPI00296AC32C|nr:branched-chain amino acid ABC transporter permease [Cupriavidus sp. CV2]MDW3682140.1 branched-chain amino acid ABC transporter permease [Cupriavidus sp. CV2]